MEQVKIKPSDIKLFIRDFQKFMFQRYQNLQNPEKQLNFFNKID